MEYKNIITYTAIVVVIAVIIIGGFIILNPGNPYSNSNYSSNLGNNEQKESNKNTMFIDKNTQIFIENSSKAISESYVSTFKELKKTSNPTFKVGEKYFYHRWSKRLDRRNLIFVPEEYDTVVEVKRIDRINKTNYYILKAKNVSVYPQILVYKDGVWKKEVPKIATIIHGKDENGTNGTLKEESVSTTLEVKVYEAGVLHVNEETGEGRIIEIHSNCPVLYGMFAKWMLYLNEGVSWVEKHNVSNTMIGTVMSEIDWKVVDIEKVNGRKCFKVVSITKTKILDREGEKMSGEVVTYWVDVEKRILVKMERKEDNVLTEKIELTNYEKP